MVSDSDSVRDVEIGFDAAISDAGTGIDAKAMDAASCETTGGETTGGETTGGETTGVETSSVETTGDETTGSEAFIIEETDNEAALKETPLKKALVCRHNDMDGFYASINNRRLYGGGEGGYVKAGIVPHHLVAAPLISGFFEMCANAADTSASTAVSAAGAAGASSPDAPEARGIYDTVVVVAPNHAGGIGDIVYSSGDWDILGGVQCDAEITAGLADMRIDGLSIVENDDRVESDHSASVLIPYIAYYFPGAKVAPILVTRTMPLDGVIAFSAELSKLIHVSGKRVLLVCSIDFSHFRSPAESILNDKVTADAIDALDYMAIYNLPGAYIDSPAALIIFLRYIDGLGISPEFIDHADASEFIGAGIEETTSYFIIAGRTPFVQLSFVGDIMLHE